MIRPTLKALAAAAFAAAIFAGAPSYASDPAPAAKSEAAAPAPFETFDASAPPIADHEPYVSINGKTWNTGQFRALATLAMREQMLGKARLSPNMVGALTTPSIESAGRLFAAISTMASKAGEKGAALGEEQQKTLDSFAGSYTDALLFQRFVTDRIKEATAKDLDDLYEQTKETTFKVKEELRLRTIFASTYEEYTVKEGDSLESIAKAFGSDTSALDKILSFETKRPRTEDVEKPGPKGPEAPEEKIDITKLPPRPLVEGEKLLVPVRGEKEANAKKKIEAAYAALESGKEFMEVAKEFSESERKGELMLIRPEDNQQPIMPEMKEAFMSVADGGFSKPIRTKHGFQIVFREKYTAPGYTSRADADAKLKATFGLKQREQLIEAFFQEAVSDPQNVVIEGPSLAKAEAERKPEDLIVTVGGRKVTRGELDEFTTKAFSAEPVLNADIVRGAVRAAAPLRKDLVEGYSRKLGIKDDPAVVQMRAGAEQILLAKAYMDKVMEEKFASIPEDELKAFYEKNVEFYKVKESYNLGLAVVKGDPAAGDDAAQKAAATAKLAEALKGAASEGDFINVATGLNPQGDPRFRGPGKLGPVQAARLSEPALSAIRKVAAPGMSEIVWENGEAGAYWVVSATPEKQFTLAEKLDEVSSAVKAEKRRDLLMQLFNEYGNAAEVKSLRKAEIAGPEKN